MFIPFLSNHHAERGADCHLPQRNGGGEDQRDEHSGDEESLVDLMAPDLREQPFQRASHCIDDQRDRKEVQRPMDDARDQIIGRERQPHGPHGRRLPVGQRLRTRLDGQVGLQAGVVHRHRDRAREGEHHEGHDPLEVHGIAHVRGAGGDASRGVEEGICGLIQRIEPFESAPFVKLRLDAVEQLP
jgi:hypothetical protein